MEEISVYKKSDLKIDREGRRVIPQHSARKSDLKEGFAKVERACNLEYIWTKQKKFWRTSPILSLLIIKSRVVIRNFIRHYISVDLGKLLYGLPRVA